MREIGKTVLSVLVGILIGILIMGGLSYYLWYHYTMDLIPWIMVVDVLILILLGVIGWLLAQRKVRKLTKAQTIQNQNQSQNTAAAKSASANTAAAAKGSTNQTVK